MHVNLLHRKYQLVICHVLLPEDRKEGDRKEGRQETYKEEQQVRSEQEKDSKEREEGPIARPLGLLNTRHARESGQVRDLCVEVKNDVSGRRTR